MICRLYEVMLDTGFEIESPESCHEACENYSLGSYDTNCVICSNKEKNLCKDRKFSWVITRHIQLDAVSAVDYDETLYQAIKIIHPASKTIWLFRWLKKNKEDEFINSFSLFISGQEHELEKIDDINWFLKNKVGYDGRKITLKDFEIGE